MPLAPRPRQRPGQAQYDTAAERQLLSPWGARPVSHGSDPLTWAPPGQRGWTAGLPSRQRRRRRSPAMSRLPARRRRTSGGRRRRLPAGAVPAPEQPWQRDRSAELPLRHRGRGEDKVLLLTPLARPAAILAAVSVAHFPPPYDGARRWPRDGPSGVTRSAQRCAERQGRGLRSGCRVLFACRAAVFPLQSREVPHTVL